MVQLRTPFMQTCNSQCVVLSFVTATFNNICSLFNNDDREDSKKFSQK
jgi:hypothetical protein